MYDYIHIMYAPLNARIVLPALDKGIVLASFNTGNIFATLDKGIALAVLITGIVLASCKIGNVFATFGKGIVSRSLTQAWNFRGYKFHCHLKYDRH